ncbi:MAG TPA: hypothetical protein VGB67_08685 [Fibrella sp.]
MKRVLLYSLVLSLLFSACAPVYVLRNDRPNRPHDNGKHKGWYKNGRYGGLPPGQAKKQGRYDGLPPGQAKKQRW